MNSASEVNPTPEAIDVSSTHKPQPLNSLIASARRLTGTDTRNPIRKATAASWQEDAWDMYDLVGEQRFLAATLAGRLAQANLYVGTLTDDPTEQPEAVTDTAISDILDSIGDSAAQRAQMIYRLGINMFVAGDAWIVGIPPSMLPEQMQPVGEHPDGDIDNLLLSDLDWRTLSVSEVATTGADEVTLILGNNEGEKIKCSPEDVYLLRVWRPHPRRSWDADSPTRSSLPVLRELVGLTMHISAQIDSRLAGAGLLIVPQTAARALRIAAGLDEDSAEDPFTDALIEAMMTPINDRASASAQVPLVVTVPDESADKFQYMTFAKPLDSEARTLRDEAIRRLALGQDAPPELLLGVGGMNHWGAWLVREDVVSTHLEPPLALICDALTTQYLWPVLEAMGKDPDEIHRHVIWYDVSHMITRPNRASDALALYDKGVLNDETLRNANGFDETDAPGDEADDPATLMTLDLIRRDPSLIREPGLHVIVEQVRALLKGETVSLEDVGAVTDSVEDDSAEGGDGEDVSLPDTQNDDAPDLGLAASGAPAAGVSLGKVSGRRARPSPVDFEPQDDGTSSTSESDDDQHDDD